ncbi:MAG: hypothetical protein ACREN8_05830 [Candidatus Dormibacteraceae bacterium]
MRGAILGLFLIVVLSLVVLWRRPGGLRRQLRAIRHRLHLAVTLAGIYLLTVIVLQLSITDSSWRMWATVAIAVTLAVIFLLRSADDYSVD